MTREEEIENKAIEKSAEYRFEQLYSYNNDVYSGFIQGAQWADKNPKSPWISVKDDLPCNHSDLILTYNGTPFSTKRVLVMTNICTLFLCEMKKDNDRGWIWNYPTKDKITHWFPIPELLKE